MAVDLRLVDDLGLIEARDSPQSPQTLRGKTPVDEVVVRIDVAGLVNLDRRGFGREARAVGLEHDLAARRQHVDERSQERDRIGHPVQDSEAQRNVEALAELAHVKRVHAAVLDPRSDEPGERAEAGAARQRHAEAGTHPVDVLLIVDRDNAPRAADLRQEAVEAVESADVEHATSSKAIRAEHRKAVAVVACDTRRVDPGSKREGMKPKRNRIAHALGVRCRSADGVHVGDQPLGRGRLRDRLDRGCRRFQRVTPNVSGRWRLVV